jgi:hypothetical protein
MSKRWQTRNKNKKIHYLFLAFILSFILCVSMVAETAYADGKYVHIPDDREPFLSSQKKSELENALMGADFADHLMTDWMVQLMKAVELHSVESLVFGSPGEMWWDQPTYGTMMYGTFHEREVSQILQPTVQLFLMLFAVGLCGAILYSTLKIGVNPHNPNTKYEFAENVKSWFLSGLFFASYPTILDLIFGLNESVRMTFYDWLGRGFALSYLSDTAFHSENTFGAITLAFIEFVIVLYLNFIYLARKFILMLLIVIGPVMGILLFFTRLRTIVGRWFKELISNTFIQSIHAILIFIMSSSSGFTDAGSFAKLAWLFLLIPVSAMLSQWMGIGGTESRIEQRLNLLGLGSISGMTALSRESMSIWQKQRKNMNFVNQDSSEKHLSDKWGDNSSFDHSVSGSWEARRVSAAVSRSQFDLSDKLIRLEVDPPALYQSSAPISSRPRSSDSSISGTGSRSGRFKLL